MIFLSALIILGIITRLAFFGHPGAVVFDEVYNGSFVNAYSTGSFYFDIHPPLGKLLMKFWGDLIGASSGIDFSAIGNVLPFETVLLRLLPIIVGILLPIVIYLICRKLDLSKWASFAAGLLVVFENSLVVQSRFILFDGFLLLFGFLSVLFYLFFAENRKRRHWLILSCLFAAGAFSVKWTGLAFPLLIILIELTKIWKDKKNLLGLARFLSLYAFVGIIAYCSVFAVHFAYLTNSGPGDPFLSDRFQKTLAGNPHATNADLVPKGFFGKTIELNFQMYDGNFHLSGDHPYSSAWYTWPFMARTIFYWESTKGDAAPVVPSYIYLIGNPFIYWLATLAIVNLIILSLRKKERGPASLFIILGFLVNFIPFIFIGRVMFLYHYGAALIFSITALVFLIDQISSERKKIMTLFTVVVLALAVFLFFSPLTYGTPLDDRGLQARMWFSSWR